MLLVTAFEAFGGRSQNSSAQLLDYLESRRRELEPLGIAAVTALLPVSYERAPRFFQDLVERYRPTRIVCLGEAASAARVRLETLARNRDAAAKADNDGQIREESVIDPGASREIASRLDLDSIEWRLALSGVPVERSEDAGGYLCNHVFFRASLVRSARAGFIHLPLEVPPAWCEPLLHAIFRDA